eukprot:scaffold7849_cov457-Prasinococcus_capsulatus_cf.AAC.9
MPGLPRSWTASPVQRRGGEFPQHSLDGGEPRHRLRGCCEVPGTGTHSADPLPLSGALRRDGAEPAFSSPQHRQHQNSDLRPGIPAAGTTGLPSARRSLPTALGAPLCGLTMPCPFAAGR